MRDSVKRNFLVQFGVHWVVTFALLLATVSERTSGKKKTRMSHDGLVSLRSAKLIYVISSSFALGESLLEELSKRPEFQRLGLMITRDITIADLLLELRHYVLTQYDYLVIDRSTRLVVVSGKLSALDGKAAKKVAKRFMKQMVKARAGLSQ